jgi:ATP-binding cassette subfamily B multidrug efflux pump
MAHIRKLLPFVKPYWRWAVLCLALLTSVVFMDLAIPRLIQRIVDQGISQHNQAVVLQTSAIMLGVSLTSALFAIANNYYSVRVGESVARDLRDALFLKIQSFSYGNLDHFTTGKLIVRLTSDTSAVQRIVQISLRIGTRAPMLMIGSLILMFKTNQQLALTMIPLLLVTSTIIIFFSMKMEPMFRIVQQKLDWMNTVLQENIAGARVVKSFVRADYENERFDAANTEFTNRTIRVMQFMSSMSPVLTIFINIGIVTVIYIGGLQAIRGDLTDGEIIAFTNYLLTTMGPLILMTMLANTFANGLASMQRLEEVFDTVPEVRPAEHPRLLPDDTRGKVAFENVSFHYNSRSDGLVLENVNLSVEPGQMVAILGATGAGKSSLVQLIPRFYDAAGGRITVDDIDIRELDQNSLVTHVGIVPQETILFSGTVRDNIRYGRPEASEEEVLAAAKAAQAHEFILALPQGYDTHVEERGVNLSGGQKQRIAIARAIITRPKILILDDSTSSVDVETETRIQSALDEMLHSSTSFVVAQRISTVLNADKILVIDKGKIAAEGSHAELMRSSPIYREIYDSQLGNGFRAEVEASLAAEGGAAE